MESSPRYSVAIRTLGTAGEKYTMMIKSLERQTHRPDAIYIYIAEGYPLPERAGSEIYVRTPKGMVTQRARSYQEIDSEYLLLCDDDILFEPDSVEKLFAGLNQEHGDVIGVNVHNHHKWSLKEKLIWAVFNGVYPSFSRRFAYPVRRSAFFSYSIHPCDVMESQSFCGACLLIKKKDFLSISMEDECWMDRLGYPVGEDLLLSYKLYRYGYKVLVHSSSGITHLDAQAGHGEDGRVWYLEGNVIRYVMWYRMCYQPAGFFGRGLCIIAFYFRWLFRYAIAFVSRLAGRNRQSDKEGIMALKEGRKYVRSSEFSSIPLWKVVR